MRAILGGKIRRRILLWTLMISWTQGGGRVWDSSPRCFRKASCNYKIWEGGEDLLLNKIGVRLQVIGYPASVWYQA